MPNTREKLIELLERSLIYDGTGREMRFTGSDVTPCLIANGVTLDNQVSSSKWISVKDRLPEDDCPVLVTCGKGYRSFIARYDHVWKCWKVSHTLRITHWMPLPEPPKGE